MPLYEYRCLDCQHVFEAIKTHEQRDDGCVCPLCRFESKRIPVSTIAVHYKGGGFYCTDNPAP